MSGETLERPACTWPRCHRAPSACFAGCKCPCHVRRLSSSRPLGADDALIASVLRKLAASPADWFDCRNDDDRDPWVCVDGTARVTPEEYAAVERMLTDL